MQIFYIPRLSNDIKIAVQKNHLGGQISYRTLDPAKKRRHREIWPPIFKLSNLIFSESFGSRDGQNLSKYYPRGRARFRIAFLHNPNDSRPQIDEKWSKMQIYCDRARRRTYFKSDWLASQCERILHGRWMWTGKYRGMHIHTGYSV